LRAVAEVELKGVSVIVRKVSDQEVIELALIEHLQREGLNPTEEALAYERFTSKPYAAAPQYVLTKNSLKPSLIKPKGQAPLTKETVQALRNSLQLYFIFKINYNIF
jgi:hypothetical protein